MNLKFLLPLFISFLFFGSEALCQRRIQVDKDDKPPELNQGEGFIGGEEAFLKFIKDNKKIQVQDTKDFVLIYVYINSEGQPINYEVIKETECNECNKESLRLIKLIGHWIPPKKKLYKGTKHYKFYPTCYLERIDW